MTFEIETLKTNEFLRRRKLRLQQVREQSKDIAKKIRQRTKEETLAHIIDLDAKKEKEYRERQGKVVKRLEHLYSKRLHNFGTSHKNAAELKQNEDIPEKLDISQLRGKEAVADLRRKKQEKLDEQKKLLDRKVQARTAANEISREKSSAVVNKFNFLTKETEDPNNIQSEPSVTKECEKDKHEIVTKNDMATQWDFEGVPNEWEANIPVLTLPKDDGDSVKESNNNIESKSEKSKKIDLFALSDEMPSSLRGGLVNVPNEVAAVKPSLTLVSEYLQSRGLRLRETDTTVSSKKQTNDLQNIKQTILKTRASNAQDTVKINNTEKTKSNGLESVLTKKNSVMMYNHSTRDTKDVVCGNEKLVIRDLQTEDDAFSQAMKQTSIDNKEKKHEKKLQDMRNKIAMTKQHIENEYKDTMAFLNSLPKDNKPIKNAHMDERRQQLQKEHHQMKLQQEFKKIEKDYKKHSCVNANCRNTTPIKPRSKSKSPTIVDNEDEFAARDFQYSWMPVPESDGNLAIHTIPTTLKDGKSGNTVKFSKVDSYHEYRSRHQHTPPTKDTAGQQKQANKRIVETVIIHQNDNESTDCSSIATDTSSVDNLRSEAKGEKGKSGDDSARDLSDANRIIVYKILDSKNDKKCNAKRKKKLLNEIAKSLSSVDKERIKKCLSQSHDNDDERNIHRAQNKNENVKKSLEQVDEGLYKIVNEKGDNITSMYFSEKPQGEKNDLTEDEIRYGRPCCCNKKGSSDQSEKGTGLNWESGDKPPNLIRTPNSCVDYKCGCGTSKQARTRSPPIIQPSTATSTSSFKTATNDKANNALPDGGYIKLIDDGGTEAGKFYIGATGFLKDDAYEVVIQLRKKEAAKEGEEKYIQAEECKAKTTNCEMEYQSVNFPGTEIKTQEILITKAQDASSRRDPPENSPTDKETTNVFDIASHGFMENQNNNEQVIFNSELRDNQSENRIPDRKKHLTGKCINSSLQVSYVVPNVPKSDTIQKPSISTYTQTSLSSPNQRPVFIHMSSSTSTAYMSPPELVLPRFLKQGYSNTYDEIYHPQNMSIRNESIEITDEQEYCEEYTGCTCKRCTHARKIILNKINIPSTCKKQSHREKRMDTPPNTARSYASSHKHNLNIYTKKNGSSHSSPIPKTLKCRKCESRTKSKICVSHKNKRHLTANKRSSRNLKCVSASAMSLQKKSNLNPVIKKYVHKLLALNREGLKAMEVANLECSSVNTPGSSIINVPYNIVKNKPEKKISLEQIKNVLEEQILKAYENKIQKDIKHPDSMNIGKEFEKNIRLIHRGHRRRPVHKVKSLNISKHLLKNKNTNESHRIISSTKLSRPTSSQSSSSSSPFVIDDNRKQVSSVPIKSRSRSSPSPRKISNYDLRFSNKLNKSEYVKLDKKDDKSTDMTTDNKNASSSNCEGKPDTQRKCEAPILPRAIITPISTSLDSEPDIPLPHDKQLLEPSSMSTQTSHIIDDEIKFMKLAENKLQNMEKIADLTEKCTQRLSNLAKVLEEVRKNKSLAYSHITTSESTSDSEEKSNNTMPINKTLTQTHDTINDIKRSETKSPTTLITVDEGKQNNRVNSPTFVPFLSGIPKPGVASSLVSPLSSNEKTTEKSHSNYIHVNMETPTTKSRGKPPPALSRINLKHGQDNIIPHELSTVLEVDSPMSVKLKNQSSQNDIKSVIPDDSSLISIDNRDFIKSDNITPNIGNNVNPDLLHDSGNIIQQKAKISTTESSDDSKMQMMDLKQFNDIMLKPFISIQEYAKQCNVGALDEGSNLEDIVKDDVINDDLSSLHSDGSLPDVIAELLKRNVISEPFKFETTSNINSTTMSSESALSVLALSKIRKNKKKSNALFKNKANLAETSDELSISSNPDLENAFKKLGMGWASSTLKKTKERLALSSSSNTSTSSISQFKMKSFNKQDIPVLVTDSVSSIFNISKKPHQGRHSIDTSKNVEQQTSLTNSMTVKEFLTNELANKITFMNKGNRNDTKEVFVSLYETKMPEEMKHSPQMIREEHSIGNTPNSNNRARTSTPVQIFKSMTYQSSSSSNMSNGLFSNADELSSVKGTSNSLRNHSTSDKDDLTIPNFSLRMKKDLSDRSKSD